MLHNSLEWQHNLTCRVCRILLLSQVNLLGPGSKVNQQTKCIEKEVVSFSYYIPEGLIHDVIAL